MLLTIALIYAAFITYIVANGYKLETLKRRRESL